MEPYYFSPTVPLTVSRILGIQYLHLKLQSYQIRTYLKDRYPNKWLIFK